MNVTIIENTDAWRIDSHGNGVAYEFVRKHDGATYFVQGDDAAHWRREYDLASKLYCQQGTRFHAMTWNACLAELCNSYLP